MRAEWGAAWVLVLILAACGSADSGSTSASTAPDASDTTTTGATGTTTSEPTETTADPAPDTTAASGGSSAVPPPAEPVWFFDHLEVGDCWSDVFDEEGELDRSQPPEPVACDEPHFYQVYGAFLTEFDEYPGDDWGDEGARYCSEAAVSFIGADFPELTAISGFGPTPSEEEWDGGARRRVCVAYYDGGRVAESFEGIGTTEPRPYDMPAGAPIPEAAELFSVGDTEDGERSAIYDVPLSREEAVEQVAAAAAASGWTIEASQTASRTTLLEVSDGEDVYTMAITQDADDPGLSSLQLWYPPGPLSTYP